MQDRPWLKRVTWVLLCCFVIANAASPAMAEKYGSPLGDQRFMNSEGGDDPPPGIPTGGDPDGVGVDTPDTDRTPVFPGMGDDESTKARRAWWIGFLLRIMFGSASGLL